MAQSDFCFTYYDADAARDKAHMNRLERGAYDDFISAQRKFGHLDLKIIKKILGNDFASVWDAIELILKRDDNGKYFIEWLDNSLTRAAQHSERQRNNAKIRWDKNKNSTMPPHQSGNATALPLEGGDGDNNKHGIKTFEKRFISKDLPPSQAMIEEVFAKHGLSSTDGEGFYKWVVGKHGWENINDWESYTASVISKKLTEKNSKGEILTIPKPK